MLIGVFDSGIGGEAVAAKLKELLPLAHIVSINDHEHMPYGSKAPDEIIRLTTTALQPLLQMKCDAIVIACNTATTVAIAELRANYPDVHFIGIEPMVKPAAGMTKTRHIAVCATPQTLKSTRYQELKRLWAQDVKIIEPDCTTWAKLIEDGKSDQIDIEATVADLVAQQVDVIVLGCTHYHLVKQRFSEAAGKTVAILEPTDAIADRIKSLVG